MKTKWRAMFGYLSYTRVTCGRLWLTARLTGQCIHQHPFQRDGHFIEQQTNNVDFTRISCTDNGRAARSHLSTEAEDAAAAAAAAQCVRRQGGITFSATNTRIRAEQLL